MRSVTVLEVVGLLGVDERDVNEDENIRI